jgi:short-subunit dehydrogenase
MPVALITGASSGIGAEYARQLAKKGYDLVLVARNVDKLAVVATAATNSGVYGDILSADLATEQGQLKVADRIANLENPIDLVINNAGFGLNGAYEKQNAAAVIEQLAVNVQAVSVLTNAAVRAMLARGSGTIVNISSLAGYYPTIAGQYGATKAFTRFLTFGIQPALQGSKVHAMVVCPGPTRTGFFARSGDDLKFPLPLWTNLAKVVRVSLSDMEKGKVLSRPNRLIELMCRMAPVVPPKLVPRSMEM